MTKQDYYLPVPGNIVLRRDKEDKRGEGQGGEGRRTPVTVGIGIKSQRK